jgi:hypothetical protein
MLDYYYKQTNFIRFSNDFGTTIEKSIEKYNREIRKVRKTQHENLEFGHKSSMIKCF